MPSVGNAIHAISIHDVASDTVHQFAPTYRDYVLYSDSNNPEEVKEAPKTFRAKTFVAIGAVRCPPHVDSTTIDVCLIHCSTVSSLSSYIHALHQSVHIRAYLPLDKALHYFVSAARVEEGSGWVAAEHGDGQLGRVVQPGQRGRGGFSPRSRSDGAQRNRAGRVQGRRARVIAKASGSQADEWQAGDDCSEIGEPRSVVHKLGRVGGKSAACGSAAAGPATEQRSTSAGGFWGLG